MGMDLDTCNTYRLYPKVCLGKKKEEPNQTRFGNKPIALSVWAKPIHRVVMGPCAMTALSVDKVSHAGSSWRYRYRL